MNSKTIILVALISILIIAGGLYYYFYYQPAAPNTVLSPTPTSTALGASGSTTANDVDHDRKLVYSSVTYQSPTITSEEMATIATLPSNLAFLFPQANITVTEVKKLTFNSGSGYRVKFEYNRELVTTYFYYGSITSKNYAVISSLRMNHFALRIVEDTSYALKMEFSRIDETKTGIEVLIVKK